MELNREQIIKALECCVDEDCNNCPLHKNGIIGCHITRNKEALSCINELTQANEQLSESYDHLEKTKDELLAERSRITIELEAMRGAANAYKMHILECVKENEHRRAKSEKTECEYCLNFRSLYQHAGHTKLYIGTDPFGNRTLEVEGDKCPPYAKCVSKETKVTASFAIQFCPNCGRKLEKDERPWAKNYPEWRTQ